MPSSRSLSLEDCGVICRSVGVPEYRRLRLNQKIICHIEFPRTRDEISLQGLVVVDARESGDVWRDFSSLRSFEMTNIGK